MGHVAVTAIGADRPGIVAGVTEAIRDLGGNLEDVSSTILRGHFTMMLVVAAPEGVPAADVEEALRASVGPLGVSVTAADVEAGAPDRPEATHALVVYGSDRPGIVAGIARLLADRGVNVTNLSCRLVGEEAPVYAMVAEVQVPEGEEELDRLIEERARELDVDVTLRPIEVETL